MTPTLEEIEKKAHPEIDYSKALPIRYITYLSPDEETWLIKRVRRFTEIIAAQQRLINAYRLDMDIEGWESCKILTRARKDGLIK